MIRFCDREVGCAEYAWLSRIGMLEYFLPDHKEDVICVYDNLDNMGYIGLITYDSYQHSINVDGAIRREYVVLDTDLWKNAREYFDQQIGNSTVDVLLPILNVKGELVCFAYEDVKADREIRMLRELQENSNMLQFTDVYSQYKCVKIYEFNELALAFAKYLEKLNIPVEVNGVMWQGFFEGEECQFLNYECYKIYAEGIEGKVRNWRENLLRSVSVEFECIDKLYEANIREGNIKDVGGDFLWLVEKLSDENEIVIIGTGISSLNVWDLLISNGIDIVCFMSEDENDQKYRLFGKKVLSEREVKRNTKHPVFLECCAENSAWGFGGVDRFDYQGYQRNRRFFLIKDYIDIPVGNLQNILKDKNVVLLGNLNLCHNVSHVLELIEGCRVNYWDLLDENLTGEIGITSTDGRNISGEDVCCLIEPLYYCEAEQAQKLRKKKEMYLERLKESKLDNVTNYFSRFEVLISIQKKSNEKYTLPCLTPGNILLNISGHMSGNEFFGSLLDGHPDILLMNYGIGIQRVIDNIFLFCVQLAEEKSENILSAFWKMYSTIVAEKDDLLLSHKTVFDEKFEELLVYKNYFTSQELFVMFHMAYEKILGRDISDIQNMLLYYEPRSEVGGRRTYYEEWLCDEKVNGSSIMITRNSYIRTGSLFRHLERFQKFFYPKINGLWNHLDYIDEYTKIPDHWKRFRVKFEKIKTSPREMLEYICGELKLPWSDILLKTTMRGNITKYRTGNKEITGFDLEPVYNLYEEYFSDFDRFRLDMVFAPLQKKYDYSYVSCTFFTRRQLQEMFLKEFRFESRLAYASDYWKERYRRDFIDKVEEYFQKERIEEMCNMQI